MNIKILSFADSVAGTLCLFISGLFSGKRRNCPEKVDEIVVIKFLGYGSLILAAPSLYTLKKYYKNSKLILCTTENLQHHAGTLKLFDEITVLKPFRPLYSIFTILKLRKRISTGRTLVINLEIFSKTAIFIAAFLRGSFCSTLADKEYRNIDLSIRPEAATASTTAEMYSKLAAALGGKTDTGAYIEYLKNHYKTTVSQQRIIIAPFCSNLSLRRLWGHNKWSLLISQLRTAFPEYSLALIGAASDRQTAQEIIEKSGVEYGIHNYCGELSFEQTAVLMRESRCFCGIDSAPLHQARVSALPAVSLWGATDPFLLTHEIPGYPEVIIFARQKCTPCVHSNRKCPFPEGCLKNIDTNIVMASIADLLAGKINARKVSAIDAERS